MELAVIPTWAAPAVQEIRDAHRIVVALTSSGPPCARLEAMADTFAWLAGEGRSPLQARRCGEITLGDVDDELMFAQMVMSGPEQLHTGARAGAVELVLRWVLGLRGARPPVDLPLRHADGRVLTADELYAQRARGQPPERRTAIRAGAVRDAERSSRLAGLAESATA